MKKKLWASLAALLANASLALAQPASLGVPIPTGPVMPGADTPLTPVGQVAPAVPSVPTSAGAPIAFDTNDGARRGLRIWGSAEYLLWWFKAAPLPVPLATTGDPVASLAAGVATGSLGRPDTTVVSPNRQNFGGLSGLRLKLGLWVNAEQTLGLEASGFFTETRNSQFVAATPASTNSVLAVPILATPPLAPSTMESAIGLSGQPIAGVFGGADGAMRIVSATRLFGTEINSVAVLRDTDTLRLSLLGGVRYFDLLDDLTINDYANILGAGALGVVYTDHLSTRNKIWAGQLGGRVEKTWDRFFAGLTVKVGLGQNHETLAIGGNTTVAGAFAPTTTTPGGIFAQPTNIGAFTHNTFVVVPEVRLQAGVNLTPNVRIFAGYEFLYVSSVLRPGDQIDRTVNLSQTGGGTLTGLARPAVQMNSTDFWAHGLSVGLSLRF